MRALNLAQKAGGSAGTTEVANRSSDFYRIAVAARSFVLALRPKSTSTPPPNLIQGKLHLIMALYALNSGPEDGRQPHRSSFRVFDSTSVGVDSTNSKSGSVSWVSRGSFRLVFSAFSSAFSLRFLVKYLPFILFCPPNGWGGVYLDHAAPFF